MRLNTLRYKWNRESSPTYWRRRFFALAAGLAVFALLAWAVSGALGGAQPASSAADLPPGAHSPSPVPDAGPASPTASARPAAAAKPGASSRPARRARQPAADRGSAGGRPRTCARRDIVLSLFASQASYPAHARPAFDIDVVSTARRTCMFNVGGGHVALVIRAGRTAVWSSADCVQGRKSLRTDLVRGVPTVLAFSWNRRASSAGCKRGASVVHAGTYAATASSGILQSNTEIFRLR
ncbi:MAG: hypothetical protein ABSA03_07790 [Streptosporangiaceae bacterium]|jgi:hypothetical protein